VGVIQAKDGDFYGLTNSGGAANRGTIFMITPAGVETVLHSFHDGTVENDGADPLSGLIQGTDGNFYGTTSVGGASESGTVFMATPSGQETVLYSFGSVPKDGLSPYAGLVQGTDGNFYGTTRGGGSYGDGTVFSVTPSGKETTLYSFGSIPNDGLNGSLGDLIQGIDGNFYGTTGTGGDGSIDGGVDNAGTVFMVTTSGHETILHSFRSRGAENDGAEPRGLLEGTDGNFYGAITTGGSTGCGAIFQLSSEQAKLFDVTAPLSTISGSPIQVSVTALDRNGNLVVGYTGELKISSTDSTYLLTNTGPLTFKNGVCTFSIILKDPGKVTVTATDPASKTTGTSGIIVVYPHA
jgi:uncharacterized repeat protein (TIGR03803 family)